MLTSPVVKVSFGLTDIPAGKVMKARFEGTAGTA